MDDVAALKASIGASREKYWDERTPEEKLEVAKDCIQQLMRSVDSLRRQLSNYESHCHAVDGRILIDSGRQSMRSEDSGWGYGFKRLLTGLDHHR